MYRSFSVFFIPFLWIASYSVCAEEIPTNASQAAQPAQPAHKEKNTSQTSEFQELFIELKDKSPSEIFNKANRAFSDKEYPSAIHIYRILNSLYPFSEYAEQARAYSVQARYHNSEMEEVIKGANQFGVLYPTSEYLEGILYLKAKAYFYRGGASFLHTLDRLFPFLKIDFSQRADSMQLAEAAYQFSEFLRRFPNGTYREKAQAKLEKVHRVIIQKEYAIAHFYFTRKNYLAAYNRIVSLLERYPRACDMLSKKYADTLYKDYQYAKKQLGLTV